MGSRFWRAVAGAAIVVVGGLSGSSLMRGAIQATNQPEWVKVARAKYKAEGKVAKPSFHAAAEVELVNTGKPGTLHVSGKVVVLEPLRKMPGFPDADSYDIILEIATPEGEPVKREVVDEFVDKVGVGNFTKKFHATYQLPSGNYAVQATVRHRVRQEVYPNGSTRPFDLCDAGGLMAVD
jgi:hypothetical protein